MVARWGALLQLRSAEGHPALAEPLDDLTVRLYMTKEAWSGAPSPDQRKLTELAHRDLDEVISALVPCVADTLSTLKKSVEQAGIVWPADELPATLPDNLIPYIR